MVAENWKQISNFENYEISNLGNLRNFKTKKHRSLKPNKYGYIYIPIVDNNKKRKSCGIHKLVGKAFLPNPDNLSTIDHINRNRADNRLENLRWASHKKQTKTCNTCNLTLDISEFQKNYAKCKKCYKKHVTCKHDKPKRYCRECCPQYWCEHNTRKGHCPKCSPQNFCEHDAQKWICCECNPKLLCIHNTRKGHCPKCNPKLLCEHNIRKWDCPVCNPKLLCKHDKHKRFCRECSPQNSCIHCKHILVTKLRYVKSLDKKIKCCARCFYNFYPNDKIPRKYKLRQHFFNENLTKKFGINFFQYDKKIKCGCSGRIPDWFIDCYKYSIIIELDEDQHKSSSCDQKRMMELFKDLGNRPLVMIRINPDKYKIGKEKIEGCFEFDEKNILICNEKKFNKRFNLLVKTIKYYIDNEPTKEITMEKLFFDIY